MKRRILLIMCALALAVVSSLAWPGGAARADATPAVVQISASDATINMASANKLSLSASVLPADASQRVTWRSSDTSVAKVDSKGVVTARKRGTAVITATANKTQVTAQCVVTVINTNLPDNIDLGAATLSLVRFQTWQLHPTVTPATAAQEVRWKSSRSSVVSVSSSGLLTAKKAGTATITCYSAKDKAVQRTLMVTVRQQNTPSSITLTPAVETMVVGSSLQMTATASPADACSYFEWKSSSAGRATVSDTGLVTAKKTGWVTITCRSRQNRRVQATRKILVISASSPTGISLNAQNLTLYVGNTYQLEHSVLPAGKDNSVSYKSSKNAVAQVGAGGLITARKAGTATITVSSRVNSEVQAKVTVKVENAPAPGALVLSAASAAVTRGGTLQMKVTASPSNASTEVKWSTSNKSVAAVSSTGLVTGKKGGTAIITATSRRNSRVKATYQVTVTDPKSPTAVQMSDTYLTLEVGQQYAVSATVLPQTGVDTGIKWGSSASSVAKVSSGTITARKAGTAVISATSTYNSSVGGSVLVNVVNRPAPTSISVSLAGGEMSQGETAQLTVTPSPSTASRLCKYTTSDSSVLSVDSTGKLTAKKAGVVTITVTSAKKKTVKSSLTIKVYDATSPRALNLSSTTMYLGLKDSATLRATVIPATAHQGVSWKSSDSAVVSVDKSGKLTAGSKSGTATITCTTDKMGVTATCLVTVLDTTLSTIIPDRITDISGISANLAKIEAIRKSAVNQVASLAAAGKITSSESSARQAIIGRAFEMQAFPWMTVNTQEYWTKAYAYKRYLPGNVYYGLPYIQTGPSNGYLNRRYNVAKALSENRYTSSGKGYYLLNQANLLDGMYCGNDCSAFVSISQFGTSHPASYLNTVTIATSAYYQTISGYDNLRPGDLLVKSGDHTILFLYYVDSAKSRMMIIEQGGDGSTVICSIYNRTWFSSRGYVPRRQVSFAK